MSEPTIKIHERDLRGKTNMGWLDSKHTFSFGHFMDPTRMGFRFLRVINDDTVTPGAGFGTHPHNNMEIISVVLEGALEHKDSMGTGSVIHSGEIQKMSAGTGVTHSEFNHSKIAPVHFYQIWIVPDEDNIKPSYEQITLDPKKLKENFVVVGDRHASDNVISIHQNVQMLVAMPESGRQISYMFDQDRYGFLQVARGRILLNGEELTEGDGAEISYVKALNIEATTHSELILFDMG